MLPMAPPQRAVFRKYLNTNIGFCLNEKISQFIITTCPVTIDKFTFPKHAEDFTFTVLCRIDNEKIKTYETVVLKGANGLEYIAKNISKEHRGVLAQISRKFDIINGDEVHWLKRTCDIDPKNVIELYSILNGLLLNLQFFVPDLGHLSLASLFTEPIPVGESMLVCCVENSNPPIDTDIFLYKFMTSSFSFSTRKHKYLITSYVTVEGDFTRDFKKECSVHLYTETNLITGVENKEVCNLKGVTAIIKKYPEKFEVRDCNLTIFPMSTDGPGSIPVCRIPKYRFGSNANNDVSQVLWLYETVEDLIIHIQLMCPYHCSVSLAHFLTNPVPDGESMLKCITYEAAELALPKRQSPITSEWNNESI